MLEISLEHLKEEEVELIRQVLERDAKIQKQEDARRRRLQNSVKGERIPEKRLSIHIRTGEWMSEMTSSAKSMKRRGTDLVRASIRKKASTKPKSADEDAGDDQENQKQPNKPTAIVTPTNKSPVRKTSIRKKKTSSTQDKQIKEVKFDTDKTEKYIYEQPNVEAGSQESLLPDTDVKKVPTIVIDDGSGEPKNDLKIVEENVPEPTKNEEPASYDTSIYSSNATFESYHNSFATEMNKPDEKIEENAMIADTHGSPKSEKPRTDEAPSGKKKIRVVKRKGSSRRKPGPKITDDDSRNTLFGKPDEEKPDQDKQDLNNEKEALSEKIEQDIVHEIESIANEEPSKPDPAVVISSTPTEIHDAPAISAAVVAADVEELHVKELVEETIKPILSNVDSSLDEIMESKGDDVKVLHEVTVEEKRYAIPFVDLSMASADPNTVTAVKETSEDSLIDDVTYKNDVSEKVGEQDTIASKAEDLVSAVIESPQPAQNQEDKIEGKDDVVEDVAEIIKTITEESTNIETVAFETEHAFEKIEKDDTKLSLELETKDPLTSELSNNDSIEPDATKNEFSVSAYSSENKITSESSVTEDNSTVENILEPPQQQDPMSSPEKNGLDESEKTIVGNLVEEVLNTAGPDATTMGEKPEEQSAAEKPKKKVVKKIVKKKKPAEGEQHESPKSEAADQENDEGSPKNISRLSRTKTVRKKVVRKAPPPQQ